MSVGERAGAAAAQCSCRTSAAGITCESFQREIPGERMFQPGFKRSQSLSPPPDSRNSCLGVVKLRSRIPNSSHLFHSWWFPGWTDNKAIISSTGIASKYFVVHFQFVPLSPGELWNVSLGVAPHNPLFSFFVAVLCGIWLFHLANSVSRMKTDDVLSIQILLSIYSSCNHLHALSPHWILFSPSQFNFYFLRSLTFRSLSWSVRSNWIDTDNPSPHVLFIRFTFEVLSLSFHNCLLIHYTLCFIPWLSLNS